MYLFEFMDIAWLPASLRQTLREILDCTLSRPFRGYYENVVAEVLDEIRRRGGVAAIVELGAGTAPLTRRLAEHSDTLEGVELIPCDLYPDATNFRSLEDQFPDSVHPIYKSVDFSQPMDFPKSHFLILSAAFHHLPPDRREDILSVLSAHPGFIIEPIQHNLHSILLSWLILIPALLTPLILFARPGSLRRMFWCWTLVAPLMIFWDGVVSCLRCWTPLQWKQASRAATESMGKTKVTLAA